MSKWFIVPALLLALPLCAEWPGDNKVGGQIRLDVPGADLPDAVGSSAPGLGLSIQAELHTPPFRFERSESMICARLELGGDAWRKLGGSGDRSVDAYHVGCDVLYFLKDDGREFLNGPYLIGGVEGMAWVVGAEASSTGMQERAFRAGFSVGLGCRLSESTDVELKFLGSQVDPSLKVGVAMLCLDVWL
jgi:hypothetical protein